MSMMEFSSNALHGFQFGSMADQHAAMAAGLGGLANNADLSDSVAFSDQGLMRMPGQTDFATLPPDAMGNMAAFTNMNMGPMADAASVGLYNPPDLRTGYTPTTLDPDFAVDMAVENVTRNQQTVNSIAGFAFGGNTEIMRAPGAFNTMPLSRDPTGLILDPSMGQFQANIPPSEPREGSVPVSFHSPASTTSKAMSQTSASQLDLSAATPGPTTPVPSAAAPPLPAGPPRPDSKNKDIYSKSGFDMLRALWYVATRKNAMVEIGAVDMSCAFVVCDLMLNDCPIIYVSDNFQNLTGYNRHEIVGRNCRFLQSPDSKVEAGTKREFVDNDAVFKLKNAVAEGREIQQSLINYRKGGKPFLNLLTMIPIPWDSDEMRYCIGFQIDLVECPDAISGKEQSGAVQVNYRHSDIGQYIWTPPSSTQWDPESSGQTLGVDDVSALIQQLDPTRPPSDWHKQSWDKMLLENADDVIHVLSLKGLFLYVSPSCKKMLEYNSADLVGTALSSICHPSDIVPVTREIKDAQQNVGVNIAFRIRRKQSGYMWFESHGTLFYEQAKGRKYLILVGRKRPVFALRRRDLVCAGGGGGAAAGSGAGDAEIWAKTSTSGLLLSVSSAVRGLLDLRPEDLMGTSMQEMMRRESRAEFGRTVEKARRGGVAGFRCEVVHRKGHGLPAEAVFYPGDVAPGGGKPSFLIARVRVGKGGRAIAGTKTSSAGSTMNVGLVEDVAMAGTGVGVGMGMGMGNTPSDYHQSPENDRDDYGDGDNDEDDDIFEELHTTRCTSWQYELRQMEKVNRLLADEVAQLMAIKKKRKRRKGGGVGGAASGSGSGSSVFGFGSASGNGSGSGSGSGGGGGVNMTVRDCANCHKRDTPEWRRGPSGMRDLCNGCGLRWAKQVCLFPPYLFPDKFGVANGKKTTTDGQSLASQQQHHVHFSIIPVSQW
jgi:PAS domain S-box-containing protein